MLFLPYTIHTAACVPTTWFQPGAPVKPNEKSIEAASPSNRGGSYKYQQKHLAIKSANHYLLEMNHYLLESFPANSDWHFL